jgi:multidrug resistance efflux pump
MNKAPAAPAQAQPIAQSPSPAGEPVVAPARAKSLRVFTLIRFACAVTLITVSLWALLLPPLFPYSVHAVVNTKVVTIKAVEAGRIERLTAERLAQVTSGQEIARVARDEARLFRDRQEADFTRQKLQVRLESLDAAIRAETERLDAARAEQSRTRSGLDRLQAQARENTVEKVRLRREELAEKRAIEERVSPLFKEGIVTAAQWSRTRSETLDAERALREAEAELAAVAEGLSAGADPAREAIEGHAARILGLEREVTGLNLQRIDLAAQLAEIDARVEALARRQTDSPAYALTTPINGLVWRRLAVDGEIVAEGQAVVEVADRSALFVEAYFRRDFLNSITVGDRANVYLVGGARHVSGRVAEVQAQERANREPDIINTAPLDPSMLRVRVELDPGSVEQIQLGALAKVLITSGRPGFVERGLLRLSLLLRSHQ